MTLCPIALAVGCQKCPAFKICPLKGVIGDKPKPPAPVVEAARIAKPRKATAGKAAAGKAAARKKR